MLRQALKRLPPYLLRKWGEYCLLLRRREEPSLEHLEKWLQDRVMAAKDPNLPQDKTNKRQYPNSNFHLKLEEKKCHEDAKNIEKKKIKNRVCQACGEHQHPTHKCTNYTKLDPKNRLKFIKSKKCCFNCLSPSH